MKGRLQRRTELLRLLSMVVISTVTRVVYNTFLARLNCIQTVVESTIWQSFAPLFWLSWRQSFWLFKTLTPFSFFSHSLCRWILSLSLLKNQKGAPVGENQARCGKPKTRAKALTNQIWRTATTFVQTWSSHYWLEVTSRADSEIWKASRIGSDRRHLWGFCNNEGGGSKVKSKNLSQMYKKKQKNNLWLHVNVFLILYLLLKPSLALKISIV